MWTLSESCDPENIQFPSLWNVMVLELNIHVYMLNQKGSKIVENGQNVSLWKVNVLHILINKGGHGFASNLVVGCSIYNVSAISIVYY